MHFSSRLQLVQENDVAVAAMVDKQALRAGNYVRVIEIPGISRVPIILLCPPRAPAVGFFLRGGGTCLLSQTEPALWHRHLCLQHRETRHATVDKY